MILEGMRVGFGLVFWDMAVTTESLSSEEKGLKDVFSFNGSCLE